LDGSGEDGQLISPAIVSALISACAPQVSPQIAAGIVRVESYSDPWALGDNTDKRSYAPKSYGVAVALAHRLVAEGHSVDMGIAQINSVHLGQPGVTIESMLHPCPNLRASQRILNGDLAQSSGNIVGALSRYNSGSPTRSIGYAHKVLSVTQEVVAPKLLSAIGGTLSTAAYRGIAW
jgi:type IV secretion system protein VirB1